MTMKRNLNCIFAFMKMISSTYLSFLFISSGATRYSLCAPFTVWEGLVVWPGGMHTHLSAIQAQFRSWPSSKLPSWCFTSRVIHKCVCVSSLGWTSNWAFHLPALWTLNIPRVIHKVQVSRHERPEQIKKNSCPNLWRAFHQRHSRTLSQ